MRIVKCLIKKLRIERSMNKIHRFFFVAVCVVAISACAKKTIPTAVTASPPKLNLAVDEIDFEYLQGKARMILRDANKEREVKANIRIHKDSVIWMTFS